MTKEAKQAVKIGHDGTTTSISATPNDSSITSSQISTPARKGRRRKKTRHKSKMITGYIIYASEIRKEVIKKYPNRDFGDISKLVGIEWKNLPTDTKLVYEKRAQEQNAKSKAIALEASELIRLNQEADGSTVDNVSSEQQTAQEPSANSRIINGFGNFKSSRPQFEGDDGGDEDSRDRGSLVDNGGPTGGDSCSSMSNSMNGTSEPFPNNRPSSSQCSGNNASSNVSNSNQATNNQTALSPSHQGMRTNIVYRKPATVRLRPKDATTQTDSIPWVKSAPKKPLKFSIQFLEHLKNKLR